MHAQLGPCLFFGGGGGERLVVLGAEGVGVGVVRGGVGWGGRFLQTSREEVDIPGKEAVAKAVHKFSVLSSRFILIGRFGK